MPTQNIDFSAVASATFNGTDLNEIKLNGASVWSGSAQNWVWTRPALTDTAGGNFQNSINNRTHYIPAFHDESTPGYSGSANLPLTYQAQGTMDISNRVSMAGDGIAYSNNTGSYLLYNSDNSVSVMVMYLADAATRPLSVTGSLSIIGGNSVLGTTLGIARNNGTGYAADTGCSTGRIQIGWDGQTYNGRPYYIKVADISNKGVVTGVYSGRVYKTLYFSYVHQLDDNQITTTVSGNTITIVQDPGAVFSSFSPADITIEIGDFGHGYNIYSSNVNYPNRITTNLHMIYATDHVPLNTSAAFPACRSIRNINEVYFNGGTYAG